MRTLTNWEPQLPGKKSIHWDGLDQTGAVNVLNEFNVSAQVLSFAIPKTAFFLINERKSIDRIASSVYPMDWQRFALYPHAKIPWSENIDVPFNFFAEAVDESSFKIILPKQTSDFEKIYSTNNEIYISFGENFVAENPNAVVPAEYTIAYQDLRSGDVLMVVNMIMENNRIAAGVKKVSF
ncbi:hypothetical protein ISS22_02180 [candidate division KSB1 bacterium]|nr:hypothetical protein [candidate division KSB1 bacterium]